MKKPSAKTLLTSLDVAFKIGLIFSLLCIAYSQIMIASEVSRTNKILSFNGMYSTDPTLDVSISHLLAVMADGSVK